MELHSRMVSAKLWDDMDLAEQFPALGILFYGIVLPQMAEDSGCLKDDMRLVKKHFFSGDDAVTVELLQAWRDRLVALGKLRAYTVDGRAYLWMANFLTYQKVPRPRGPQIPLPPWLHYAPPVQRGAGQYTVDPTHPDFLGVPAASAQPENVGSTPSDATDPLQDTSSDFKTLQDTSSDFKTLQDTSSDEKSFEDPESRKKKVKIKDQHLVPDEPEPTAGAMPERVKHPVTADVRTLTTKLQQRLFGDKKPPTNWRSKNVQCLARLVDQWGLAEVRDCANWMWTDAYWQKQFDSWMALERAYPKWQAQRAGLSPPWEPDGPKPSENTAFDILLGGV